MRLSRKISSVSPSQTIAVTGKAKQMMAEGIDVVMLSAGEPDFDTPAPIKQAAVKALQENHTHYTANAGIKPLREAISNKLEKENGLNYSPEEIIVTTGAKLALYNGLRSIVNTGDEVLLPAPCWVSYVEQIKLSGGTPVLVFGKKEKPTAAEIEEKITDKTTVLMLNSPSNPVGYVYSKKELQEIAAVVEKHDLMVITDEIYEHLVYGKKHCSLAAVAPEIRDRILLVNGFSKAYAMTGWRVGYAAAPPEMISLMSRIQSHQTSNTCSIAQYAALEALVNPEVKRTVAAMVKTFAGRRDFVMNRLPELPDISFSKPDGAFYFLIKVDAYFNDKIRNSLEMCTWLLEKHGLALVPGSAFFSEPHIRLSFAAAEETLDKGLSRLEGALRELRGK